MSDLEKVKLLIGIDEDDSNDKLIELLLEQAEGIIKSRTRFSKDYDYLKVEAAVFAFNQRGTEGNKSQSSGGFSTSSYFSIMSDFIRNNMPARYIIR